MTQTEFLNIVMPFKDKVFRLAKRLLVSREEAEDATQEILLKLWKNKKQFNKYKNIEAFSMTMTKNLCLDKLKSKHYEDKSVSLQKQVELNDSVNWVGKIIEELPEQQKLVLQLRDIEQYEFEEIEKVLKMKPTAVRVALSRARKAIREQLIKTHSYGVK